MRGLHGNGRGSVTLRLATAITKTGGGRPTEGATNASVMYLTIVDRVVVLLLVVGLLM